MRFNFNKPVFYAAVFFLLPLQAAESDSEAIIVKKIYAHVAIQDPHSACVEAEQFIQLYPHSKPIYEAYIYALAKAGQEKKMLLAWKHYSTKFDAPHNREILEIMAWGILHSSSQAASPLIRLLAVLGAFYGQDAEGVEILAKSMKDPNSLVRGASVQLSSHLRDAKLKDSILTILKQEKNWNVKNEAIKASGEMQLKEAKPVLMCILSNDHYSAEEKGAAIRSLVKMYDTIQNTELKLLADNSKASMRLLACNIIEYLDLSDDADMLLKLLKDSHPEVRAAALHAVGVLNPLLEDDRLMQQCRENLKDIHPKVALTAAWTLCSKCPQQTSEVFKQYILQKDMELARMASGSLSSTGSKGVPLMRELFQTCTDPYVKLNLAVGLLQQGQDIDRACLSMYDILQANTDKWMWDEGGYFRFLAPSTIRHDDLSPNYPEAVNQATRLEILNSLAIKNFPKSQEAIRSFLNQKTVGVSGMASVLLLTEGDESSLALVENLLEDPDAKIRLQAALVLAIWGGGEKALATLYEGYAASDRTQKEKILEGLARIGESSSIPFLVDKLQEPYPSLRIIAAIALLACLNH